MFLLLIFLFSSIHAAESFDSESNSIQLTQIDHSPNFNLTLCDSLNALSHPVIETFSKDLTFYGRQTVEGYQRTIKHSYYGDLALHPYENTSRMRAYDANHLYWANANKKQSEILSYNFKTKNYESLIKFAYEILTIKLSKKFKNTLYVIAKTATFLHDNLQTQWLFLVDLNTKKEIKSIPLKLLQEGYNGGHLKMIEIHHPTNSILYCRYAGKNNAWLFDRQAWDVIKELPYTYVHTCKTNEQGNLIAIDHNNSEICICSSINPEVKLFSFNIGSFAPQSMRFISNQYLLVTSKDNKTIPLITPKNSNSFDNSSHGEFRQNFALFKSKVSLESSITQNIRADNAAVHVFDLEDRKEVFKKTLHLKYGFRQIKSYFDEDGLMRNDQFALRDSGCFDGDWYMLSAPGLEDNQWNLLAKMFGSGVKHN